MRRGRQSRSSRAPPSPSGCSTMWSGGSGCASSGRTPPLVGPLMLASISPAVAGLVPVDTSELVLVLLFL